MPQSKAIQLSFLVIGVEAVRDTDKISLEISLEWVQAQVNSLTGPGEMFYVFNFSHQTDSEKESLNISFKDLVLVLLQFLSIGKSNHMLITPGLEDSQWLTGQEVIYAREAVFIVASQRYERNLRQGDDRIPRPLTTPAEH